MTNPTPAAFCPACGTPRHTDSTFCTKCGGSLLVGGPASAALTAVESQSQPTTPPLLLDPRHSKAAAGQVSGIVLAAHMKLSVGVDGYVWGIKKGTHVLSISPGSHTLTLAAGKAGSTNALTSVVVNISAGVLTRVSVRRTVDDRGRLQAVIDGKRDPAAKVNVGRDVVIGLVLLLMVGFFLLQAIGFKFGGASPLAGQSWYIHWSCGTSSQCAEVWGGATGVKSSFSSQTDCEALRQQWASSGTIQLGGSWCSQSSNPADPPGTR